MGGAECGGGAGGVGGEAEAAVVGSVGVMGVDRPEEEIDMVGHFYESDLVLR